MLITAKISAVRQLQVVNVILTIFNKWMAPTKIWWTYI